MSIFISRKNIIPVMVILGIIPPPLIAADEAEFDSSFLQHIPGKNVIDIRRFIHGNPVPAGQYYSDIYLNGEWKGRTNIRFADTKEHGGAMLCLTPQLISMIDLISDAIKVSPTEEGCTTASPGFPVTRTHFDLSTLRLDIEVPQAFLTPVRVDIFLLTAGRPECLLHLLVTMLTITNTREITPKTRRPGWE